MRKGVAAMLGIVLLGGAAVSCSRSAGEVKEIDIAKALGSKRVEVNLSELASSIEYIPLDMGGEFLPSYHMMRMIPTLDFFYFLPLPLSDSPLFRFSADGKLLSRLKKTGRAADEYVYPLSSVLDKANKRYYVLTATDDVKIYTVDGDYITSFSCNLPGYNNPFEMAYIGDKVKFMARSKDFAKLSAFELDDTGNIISEEVLLDYSGVANEVFENDLSARIATEGKMSYEGNTLLLHKAYDSLYSYNGIEPPEVAYSVNFGNYKDGIKRKLLVGGLCYETPNHLIMQVVMVMKYFDNLDSQERINYILFDKRTGETLSLKKDTDNNSYFNNDIDGGMPFFPKVVAGDKMYQIVDAVTFIEEAKKSSSQAMKDMAKGLTEDSNPVIVVATLK